jgi:hypothetical protein
MDFCNRFKNNITTTASPANFAFLEQYDLMGRVSAPTDKIVLRVRHTHPECLEFNPTCILQWWKVLGKLILNLKLI